MVRTGYFRAVTLVGAMFAAAVVAVLALGGLSGREAAAQTVWTEDDQILAWGSNSQEQTSKKPTEALAGKAIVAGAYHSLVLTDSGSVKAWGTNYYGQTDVPSDANSGVAAIAAGYFHNLALKGGKVIAWGGNDEGQSTVPTEAQSGVKAIAAGTHHSLALKENGSVIAWGAEEDYSGYGLTSVPPEAQSDVVAIAAGSVHSLALKENGSVVAWGLNTSGQTTVPSNLSGVKVKAIAGGSVHSLALTEDGTVVGWGQNTSAQTTVPSNLSGVKVKAISAGAEHSLALTESGSVVAWGFGGDGQTLVPTAAKSDVKTISAGWYHSLALKDTAPPAPVPVFDATAGDGQVSLSWDNPTDSDFQAVRILRSTTAAATSPEPNASQTQVYEGTAESFTDNTSLTNGTAYYYTIYASDGVHFSTRVVDSATPRDTTAPNTIIASGPSGAVGSASATFTFSSEAGSTFECSLDGEEFASCTSGIEYTSLSDGSHVFEVRATDAANNTDASPARRAWTVDTVAPNTVIAEGPSGTANSDSATFDFFATQDGSTFECSLDGATFAACDAPTTLSDLSDGSHTFKMRAKDAAGNVDQSPASRTWSVGTDVTAPTVTETTPSGKKVSPMANVTAKFSESMDETSVETLGAVKLLKKGTTKPVLAVVSYDEATNTVTLDPTKSLTKGATYTATVRIGAKDTAGNALASPKTWSFRVKP